MKKGKIYISIFIMLTIIICNSNFAFSKNISTTGFNKTIRVVFPNQAGLSEVSRSGDYSGYTYEYISKIAEYENWNLEFITFDDMDLNESIVKGMEMIKNGEADIMGGMLKNDALEEEYEYGEECYGHVYTTLVSLKNNAEINSDTYRYQEPLRVALFDKAVNRNKEVTDYLEQDNVKYKIIHCNSEHEQQMALQDGKADVSSSVSLSYFEGVKTVASFAPRQYYFISTKGNKEIIKSIDDALHQISSAFPSFQNNLQIQYFGDNATGFYLTEKQKKLLSDKKVLNVLCMADAAPYIMTDEDNKLSGVLISLMNDFAKECNVDIKYDILSTNQELTTQLIDKYDCVLSVPIKLSYVIGNNLVKSESIDKVGMSSFYNPYLNKNIDDCVVGLVKDSEYAKRITQKKVVYANNIEELIDMVNKGQADVGFDNQYSVNYYIYDKYADLVTKPEVGEKLDVCIGVSNKDGNDLLAIVNEYIGSISNTKLTQYYTASNSFIHKGIIGTLAHSNPALFSLYVAGICVGIVMLIVLFISSKKKKKQLEILKKANSAKTDFLARMSHDMRTPMNGIIGLTDITIMDYDLEPEVYENMTQIKSASKYLLNLVNDTLDINRMEGHNFKLNVSPVDPKKIYNNILSIIEIEAKKKNIKLTLESSVEKMHILLIDELREEQIFINIISNAIKFTPENGEIKISLFMSDLPNNKSFTKCSIKDTGIGISKEFLPHVFEPFVQEHNGTTSKYGGTGLGMSIVKNLVNLMEGEITVDSEQGKGTEFTFTSIFKWADNDNLDTIEYKNHNKVIENNLDDTLNNKRILLCEDNELNQKIAVKLLEKKNMIVDVANNGQEGLDNFIKSKEGYYSAILMDIRMPIMNGLEATKKIRKLERKDATKIPIIAMTANAFDDDKNASKEVGMNEHLSKPIEPKQLYSTLEHFIILYLK